MITKKHAQREAKHLFHLCLVNDSLDESRTRQVARYVAAAGYRSAPAILGYFVRLVRLDRSEHTARVESATPLPTDVQSEILTGLAHLYGSGVTTAFAQRASLIGGVRIQVGSHLYDGSISGKLETLTKTI
jgi:F-type H+-transporting ATPase subunit delta